MASARPRGTVRALALETPGARLITEVPFNLRPCLRPSIRTGDRAQSNQRVHMCSSPVHAIVFQSRFDHEFVGAFDATPANWEALPLKGGVLDLVQPFGQIVQCAVARLASCWVDGSVNRQVQPAGGPTL